MSDAEWVLSDREKMFQAAELNNHKLIEHLVGEKKLQVSITDYNGRTPAHIAAMYGHLKTVTFLLEKDSSIIETKDRTEETILMKAIIYGHLSVVKYLVENWKLSISERYGHRHFGNTAIHLAATNGRLEILKYFIDERSANVNVENDLQETPLFLAAENKLYRIIQYLIEEKAADATKINVKGYNVLFKAVETDDLGLMKYLLDMRKVPFDLNWKAFFGETLLHRAVELNRENVLLYLVSEKHVRVNIQDETGETPLHKAAAKNNYRACRFLIEMGADVAVENEDGKLPVHKATDERLINYMRARANEEVRNRRSVFESPNLNSPVPYSSDVHSEGIGENNLSISHLPVVDGSLSSSNSEIRCTGPFQVLSILTIVKTIIKNPKNSINQPVERNSISSPREVILNRMDSAAISAVQRVPSLRNLRTENNLKIKIKKRR